MSPYAMQLNSEALTALESDITDFTVEEGTKLSKACADYLKNTREAIKRTLLRMPAGGFVSFSLPEGGEGAEVALKWLEGWKDRFKSRRDANVSTSSSNHTSEGSLSLKRGPEAMVPTSAPKRSKSSELRLLDFHIKLLFDLLKGDPQVVDAVLLLQESLDIANSGGQAQIVNWHLKRVKGMVPDNVEISEAVDMLSQCISYKYKL